MTFSVVFANSNHAMKMAHKEQKVLNEHAEFVEMGVLGRAAMGGPRLKFGRSHPSAHTHMKHGGRF